MEGQLDSKRKDVSSKRISKTLTLPGESAESVPVLLLTSVNASFSPKRLELFEPVTIGRQTSAKTVPNEANGYFDNKVLSRVHAQVYAEKGKVFIKDLKSSNGTFVNGMRLSEENQESEPRELKESDTLEFGVDIAQEDGVSVLFQKVTCKVSITTLGTAAITTEIQKPTSSQSETLKQSPSDGSSTVTEVMQEEYKKAVQQGEDLNRINSILNDLKDMLEKSPQEQQNELFKQLQKLNEIEPIVAKNVSLQKDNDDLKKRLQELTNDLESAQKNTIPQLQKEINSLNIQVTILKDKSNSIQNERSQLLIERAKLKETNNDLQGQIERLAKEHTKEKESSEKLSLESEKSIAFVNSKLKELQETLSVSQKAESDVKTQLESLKILNESLKKEIVNAEKKLLEKDRLEERIRDLSLQLENSNREKASLLKDNENAKECIEIDSRKIQQAEVRIKELLDELESLRSPRAIAVEDAKLSSKANSIISFSIVAIISAGISIFAFIHSNK